MDPRIVGFPDKKDPNQGYTEHSIAEANGQVIR